MEITLWFEVVLLNDGETPIGFFRIRAEYLNENEDLVDSDSTVYGEVIWPGHQRC